MESSHSDVSDIYKDCSVQEESSKTAFGDEDLPKLAEMQRNMASDGSSPKICSSEDYEGSCETSEQEESQEPMNKSASVVCENTMCQKQTFLKTITNSYGLAASLAATIPEEMILGEKNENLNSKSSFTFGEEIGIDKAKTALAFHEKTDCFRANANLMKGNLMKEDIMKVNLTFDEEICSSKTKNISTFEKDLGAKAKTISSLGGGFDSFETKKTSSEEKVGSPESSKLKESHKEGSNLKENTLSQEACQVGKENPSVVKEISCPVEKKTRDTQSEFDRPKGSSVFDFQDQLNSQIAKTMMDKCVAGATASLNTNENSEFEKVEEYDNVSQNDLEKLIESPKFGTEKEKMELKEKLSKMNVILNDELKLIREQHARMKAKKTEQKSKDEANSQNKLGNLFGIRSVNPFSNIATNAIPQFYATMFKDMIGTVSLRNIISPICGEEKSDWEAIEEIDLEAEANNLYLDPKKLDLSEFEDHATKKMKIDGGLWYKDSASRSILLKYEALPPSLSLQSSKDKTM